MKKTFSITLKLTFQYNEKISYSTGMLLTKAMANALADTAKDLLTNSRMKTRIEVPAEAQLEEGNTFWT
jgi:methionine-rich copper-binding protein CopC